MLYFATFYPKCYVIGVEPNGESIHLLKRNLSQLDINRWQIHSACIGAKDYDNVAIYDNNNGSWAVSVINYTNQNKPLAYVENISLESLLKSYTDFKNVILKVDIEGAEKELFEDRGNWVIFDSFELIIIELHDWMLPNENTAKPVFEWAVNCNREILVRGVNVFLFKLTSEV
jgi:FkbM family methyltransferase